MNRYAVAGLVVMVVSEAATIGRVDPFWSWNTPICWTGFILFADGVVRGARRNSWLSSSPREFAFLTVVSIPLWLVFEFYNLFIRNWYYVGLPTNLVVRYVGYAWAFATISPALFEAAELISVARPAWRQPARPTPADRVGAGRYGWRAEWAVVSVVAGTAMLISPFVVPPGVAQYLAAPVWLGFVFLLDPINDRLGFQSLARDWRRGSVNRVVNLLLSGLLCGILWELWNYWSRTKWHYSVPIMHNLKLFEMPLPGYLGFPPFALECFTMYVFVRGVLGGMAGLRRSAAEPRPVGL